MRGLRRNRFLLLPLALLLCLFRLSSAFAEAEDLTLDGNLFLVNREHPLGKDDVPRELAVPQVAGGGEATRLRPEAARALEEMFAAAKGAGLQLVAVSGFRTYGQQAAIHARRVEQVGKAQALRTTAPAGCSEHQLGLAMDLGTKKDIRLTAAFGQTPEGQWVAQNAHWFGFIIRYKAEWEEITGYADEPWHIRYVGAPHAKRMYDMNMPFENYIEWLQSSYVVVEEEGDQAQ